MSNIIELNSGATDPKGPPATHAQMRVRVDKAQQRVMRIAATLECMRPYFEELDENGADLQLAMADIVDRLTDIIEQLDVTGFTGADAHAYDVTGGAA